MSIVFKKGIITQTMNNLPKDDKLPADLSVFAGKYPQEPAAGTDKKQTPMPDSSKSTVDVANPFTQVTNVNIPTEQATTSQTPASTASAGE